MYQRILFWDSHEQKRLNTLPCVDQMPKFTHTCIPNDVTAKCMFVFGSSSKVESWCHSGASTTPVNTHMVNWWCDAMREREYYEYERNWERSHMGWSPWLGTEGDDARETEEFAWQFLFINLSSLLPHTHTRFHGHVLLYLHQLVQQAEGASNPKKHHAPCRS